MVDPCDVLLRIGQDDGICCLLGDEGESMLVLGGPRFLSCMIEMCRGLFGQQLELADCLGTDRAWVSINDTQRTDALPVVEGDRRSCVEAEVVIACDERAVRGAWVLGGIFDDEWVVVEDGVCADGVFAWHLGVGDAVMGFEVQPLLVEEGDKGDGGLAEVGGEGCQCVVYGIGGGVENVALFECAEAFLLVTRDGCRGHVEAPPDRVRVQVDCCRMMLTRSRSLFLFPGLFADPSRAFAERNPMHAGGNPEDSIGKTRSFVQILNQLLSSDRL